MLEADDALLEPFEAGWVVSDRNPFDATTRAAVVERRTSDPGSEAVSINTVTVTTRQTTKRAHALSQDW